VWLCADAESGSTPSVPPPVKKRPIRRPGAVGNGGGGGGGGGGFGNGGASGALLDYGLLPAVLGSSQIVLKIRGKRDAQAVVNRLLKRGHELRQEDAKREIQIYITDWTSSPAGGGVQIIGGGGGDDNGNATPGTSRRPRTRKASAGGGWQWKTYSEGDPPRHISTIILPRLPDGSDMVSFREIGVHE
jgi:hypothetical protein